MPGEFIVRSTTRDQKLKEKYLDQQRLVAVTDRLGEVKSTLHWLVTAMPLFDAESLRATVRD
jgi:hypothetical protein